MSNCFRLKTICASVFLIMVFISFWAKSGESEECSGSLSESCAVNIRDLESIVGELIECIRQAYCQFDIKAYSKNAKDDCESIVSNARKKAFCLLCSVDVADFFKVVNAKVSGTTAFMQAVDLECRLLSKKIDNKVYIEPRFFYMLLSSANLRDFGDEALELAGQLECEYIIEELRKAGVKLKNSHSGYIKKVYLMRGFEEGVDYLDADIDIDDCCFNYNEIKAMVRYGHYRRFNYLLCHNQVLITDKQLEQVIIQVVSGFHKGLSVDEHEDRVEAVKRLLEEKCRVGKKMMLLYLPDYFPSLETDFLFDNYQHKSVVFFMLSYLLQCQDIEFSKHEIGYCRKWLLVSWEPEDNGQYSEDNQEPPLFTSSNLFKLPSLRVFEEACGKKPSRFLIQFCISNGAIIGSANEDRLKHIVNRRRVYSKLVPKDQRLVSHRFRMLWLSFISTLPKKRFSSVLCPDSDGSLVDSGTVYTLEEQCIMVVGDRLIINRCVEKSLQTLEIPELLKDKIKKYCYGEMCIFPQVLPIDHQQDTSCDSQSGQ